MSTTTVESWQRVGDLIRQARIQLGYTNRKTFAEACDVSERVLSDIEAGTRTNFSGRVLSGLETGLEWPTGTIDQLVADPNLTPPDPGGGAGLVFKPPVFNRRPVSVDVVVVERAIAALTQARQAWGDKPGPAEKALAAVTVAQCWPYIIRLLEDNCLPGRELHPGVLPLYRAFSELSDWVSPKDPAGRYAAWLVGDGGAIDEQTQQHHMQRWLESRRTLKGRRNNDHIDIDPAD